MIDSQGRAVPPEVTAAAVQRLQRFAGYRTVVLKAPPEWGTTVGHDVYVYRSTRETPPLVVRVRLNLSEQDIPVYERSAHLWEFKDPIEPARDMPPTLSPTIDLHEEHERSITALLGKKVRVARSPVASAIGGVGVLNQPLSSNSIAELSFGHVRDGVPVIRDRVLDWEFIPEVAPGKPTQPSSGDQYDETRFARDLDYVIARLNSKVLKDGTQTLPLTFKKGEPLEHALSKVVAELMLRKMPPEELKRRTAEVLADAREMLITKNQNYGDSALNPVRIFATASPMEQLLVRLDDKVSRLERGQAAGEDVAKDMLGYLLLVLIAQKRERE